MPKQYGPRLSGNLVFNYEDRYGDSKITDSETGLEVVAVSKIWLDGVLSGAGQDFSITERQALQVELAELRRKLDREIAAHRENCKLLEAVEADRFELNKRLNTASEAFMTLHDIAKKVVGPKVRPPLKAASVVKGESVKVVTLGGETIIDTTTPFEASFTMPANPELIDLMTGATPGTTRAQMLAGMEDDQ